MLELRPGCEHCGVALPPESTEAMICSFECTFCRNCVESLLDNVCPNCGGGFCPRPNRVQKEYRAGVSLGRFPAGDKPVLNPVDPQSHRTFAAPIKTLPPEQR